MKEKYAIPIAIVVIAVIVAAYIVTRPPPLKKIIKIGVIGPMAFIQGEHLWYGATLAAEEINAMGGIKIGEENTKSNW